MTLCMKACTHISINKGEDFIYLFILFFVSAKYPSASSLVILTCTKNSKTTYYFLFTRKKSKTLFMTFESNFIS